MKKILLTILIMCSFLLNSSELLVICDASYFWGPSQNNAVSGLNFNPAFSGMLPNDLNLRFTHFTGIFKGQGVYSGLGSFRINPKMSAYITLDSHGKPSFDAYNDSGDYLETLDMPASLNIGSGFSYKIMNDLYAGIQLNVFMNSLAGFSTEVDLECEMLGLVSFGVNYEFKGFLLGLSLKNIKVFESLVFEGSYPDLSTLNFSIFRKFINDNLNTGIILMNINGRDLGYQAGLSLEYRIKFIYLRTAFLYGAQYLSMPFKSGIGVKYKGIDIDYTFSPGELNAYHYISFGYGYDLPEKKIRKRPPAKDEDKIFIAVLDFEARDVSDSECVVITDFIRGEMINSGYFRVLERSAINAILTELNFQQSGCTDAECAVELGKILAVHKMVVGRISKVKGKYYITTRLVDVETSEVNASVSIEAPETLDGLAKHISLLVDRLIDRIAK